MEELYFIRKYSKKPFKCGKRMVFVKNVVMNEQSGKPGYLVEDDSIVDIMRCYVVNLNDEPFDECQAAYYDRSFEERSMSFHVFKKLFELRKKNEKYAKSNKDWIEIRKERDENKLKPGDKITFYTKVYDKYERIGGIIEKIYPHRKHGIDLYDISSGTLSFKKIKLDSIWAWNNYKNGIVKRKTEDLSYIHLPEELEKVATHRLLTLYKNSHVHTWHAGDVNKDIRVNNVSYPAIVIKAVLNMREDIPNENIKKLARHKNVLK